MCWRTLFVHQPLNFSGLASLHEMPLQPGTPPLLVKRRRDPSVRSEGHADSCCGIVTVGLTRPTLHTVNYPTWSGVFNKLKSDHLLKKQVQFFVAKSMCTFFTVLSKAHLCPIIVQKHGLVTTVLEGVTGTVTRKPPPESSPKSPKSGRTPSPISLGKRRPHRPKSI